MPVDAEVSRARAPSTSRWSPARACPSQKRPGDKLVGATINKQGTLRARATAVGSDTALAQIVKLVQEAQNSKAPAQRLADRAAFWLVLVALVGGARHVPRLVLLVGGLRDDALLFAITVVVITCPDALGLATPTAIMVGTGLGAKRGILFKNAIAIEQSASLDTVVFDKTGTLTRGEPEVVEIDRATASTTASCSAWWPRSSARASIPWPRRSSRRPSSAASNAPRAEQFESVAGHGAVATVDGRRVLVGNRRLLERERVSLDGLAARADEMAGAGAPSSTSRVDGRPAGLIAIADAPRGTASEAVAALKELGIRPVMLTGDNRQTAERIAAELGIEEVLAEVLPADKAAKSPSSRREGRRSRWSATASTTRRRSPRPTSDRDRRRHRRRDRDRRRRAHALRPARRRDRSDDRARHRAEDAPEPRLGDRLQLARASDRRRRLRALGLTLRPEIAALSMSGSSVLVAVNALRSSESTCPEHAGTIS